MWARNKIIDEVRLQQHRILLSFLL